MLRVGYDNACLFLWVTDTYLSTTKPPLQEIQLSGSTPDAHV